MLEEEARRLRHSRLKLRLMPAGLYAGLPAADQLAALNPAPRGYRKASIIVLRGQTLSLTPRSPQGRLQIFT